MNRRHRGLAAVGVLLAAVLVAAAPSGSSPRSVDDDVRLNEVQVIGSHNSYHLLSSQAERDIRRAVLGDAENELEYWHTPLDTQFAHERVRQIELDVFLDSAGGRYAEPLIRTFAQGGPYDPAMRQPGIKVLHIQDVDYHSTCLTFVACLQVIEDWSKENPSHLPLAVLVELKDDSVDTGGLDFTEPEPWTAAAMDTLDDEIRSVLSEDHVLTPDDVRGAHATLEDAVLTDGWPTLGDSRGKVMFVMDNGGGYRDDYLQGHPALQGRVLFTNSEPGQPDAGFVKRNDAFDPSIPQLVADGYLVRTRADSPGIEARTGDTSTRDAALASGAQWVSTDYPVANRSEAYGTGYVAQIPGGTVARCNPVNAPVGCVDAELDTIWSPAPEPTATTTTTTTTTTVPPPVPPPADPVDAEASFTG